MQANTVEGAFASPISTSDDVSSRKPDRSPLAASDQHTSSSSPPSASKNEGLIPFGSPSAPSTSSSHPADALVPSQDTLDESLPAPSHTHSADASLPDQEILDGGGNQPDTALPRLPSLPSLPEIASPATCETTAAAALLHLSAFPAQPDLAIPPVDVDLTAVDAQPDVATATVSLPEDYAEPTQTPQAAVSFASDDAQARADGIPVQTAEAESDRTWSAALTSTSTEDQEAATVIPSDHANTLHASRLSSARPQSAPTALHQQATSWEDLRTLADEDDMPLPSRSQSEEPRQCPASTQPHGLPDEAVTPLPNRRVAALAGSSIPLTPLADGTKEYGSWWTPRLPQALTPAWLKSRKSSWLRKVSELIQSCMP